MRIGIVGAGRMGSALACLWIKAGHSVSLSFARDSARIEALASHLGPGASVITPAKAAAHADVVLLSVPFDALDAAVDAIGGPHDTKPLITTVSPYVADFTGRSVDLVSRIRHRSAAEEIASRLPGFQVVEAFNLTFADLLAISPSPLGDRRPTIPLCGDDAASKGVVAGLVADAGLVPMDLGALRLARTLEPMASAWVQLAAASGLYPLTGLSVLGGLHAPTSSTSDVPGVEA